MSTRRFRGWKIPTIEGLEERRTPSAGLGAEIVGDPTGSSIFKAPRLSTTPADGSAFDADEAPESLTFHLGGPAVFLWSDQGVELRKVEADGSESTVVDSGGWGPTDLASGDSATLTLPSTLDAGRYRIVVLGGSGLAFTYAQGEWDPMQDHTISEFQITPPKAEVDLGVVGENLIVTTGSLNGPEADSASFRIQLAAGVELWRLALQVDAGRIGSGLIAELSVYDADGREVASHAIGSLSPTDYPNDPYLYTALAPGEYLVVVSQPAGGAGGTFQLNLAADPVTGPTQVSSFRLERSSQGLTGFTIAFDSPIDPMTLRSDSMVAVDASGSIHALRLVWVGQGLTSARYEFLTAMPPGAYQLKTWSDRPLADLIGRSPVAKGLPAGVLASWNVATTDAGVVSGPVAASKIASGKFDLAPGRSIEISVTLGVDDSLILASSLTSGAMRVEVIGGADGGYVAVRGTDSPRSELWIRPGEGTFLIRITSVGRSRLSGNWVLSEASISDESLVANVIGPQGAIGLRVVERPETLNSDRRSIPAGGGGWIEAGPSPWAMVTISAPIGRPSVAIDAVAGSATDIDPIGVGRGEGDLDDAGPVRIRGGNRPISERPSIAAAVPIQTRPAHDASFVRVRATDEGALEQAERITETVMNGLRWLLNRRTGDGEPPTVAAGVNLGASPARPEAGPAGSDGLVGNVQRSALDLPFAVVIASASALQIRRAARRWWRRRKEATPLAPAPASIHGPHFRGHRRILSTPRRRD